MYKFNKWKKCSQWLFFVVTQGREIDLLVGTDVRDGNGTTRVISWCGCYLQDPHPAVRALGFLPDEGHGVYVTRYVSIHFSLQNCFYRVM